MKICSLLQCEHCCVHLMSSAPQLAPAGSFLLRTQGVNLWAAVVAELASWLITQHFFTLWCHSFLCSEQHQAAWGPRACLRTPNASAIKIPGIIYSEIHTAKNKCAEVARWKEGKKPWDLQVSVQHSKMRFTLCDPGEEPYSAWKGFITILDWSIKKYFFLSKNLYCECLKMGKSWWKCLLNSSDFYSCLEITSVGNMYWFRSSV